MSTDSVSLFSDLSNEPMANNNTERRTELAQPTVPSAESPRKNKIWSIAETLSTRAAAASTKKEEESASSSAEKSEDGDSEAARVPSVSANTLSPNGVAAAAQNPFVLWQIAARARMPFPPEFYAMMSQGGPRPQFIFNPLLMPHLGTSPIPTSVTPTTTHSNGNHGFLVWEKIGF